MNAKTVDRKLTELSFFEKSSKFSGPLNESNVKLNDNLKALEWKRTLNSKMRY